MQQIYIFEMNTFFETYHFPKNPSSTLQYDIDGGDVIEEARRPLEALLEDELPVRTATCAPTYAHRTRRRSGRPGPRAPSATPTSEIF